jgi:hypothetical protein
MDDAERARSYDRLLNDGQRAELAERLQAAARAGAPHVPVERRAPICVACAARHALIGALAVEMLETVGTLIDEGHARLNDVAWCRLYNLVDRRLHALRQEGQLP